MDEATNEEGITEKKNQKRESQRGKHAGHGEGVDEAGKGVNARMDIQY